jgi:hypothetical protein
VIVVVEATVVVVVVGLEFEIDTALSVVVEVDIVGEFVVSDKLVDAALVEISKSSVDFMETGLVAEDVNRVLLRGRCFCTADRVRRGHLRRFRLDAGFRSCWMTVCS